MGFSIFPEEQDLPVIFNYHHLWKTSRVGPFRMMPEVGGDHPCGIVHFESPLKVQWAYAVNFQLDCSILTKANRFIVVHSLKFPSP